MDTCCISCCHVAMILLTAFVVDVAAAVGAFRNQS
jgi:hypothetical protein